MDRNFAILGLTEEASKEDVKAAYQKRLQKYKSADYRDDPEYVKKKVAELQIAYEKAYSLAGNPEKDTEHQDAGNSHSKEADSSKEQRRKEYPAETEKQKRQRRGERSSLGDRLPDFSKLRNPDFSKLQNRVSQLKDTVKANVVGLEERQEQADRQSGAGEEEFTTGEKIHTSQVLGEGGKNSGEDNKKQSQIISIILPIVLTLAISGITMCEGDDDYDDYDDYNPYDYSYSFETDKDIQVYDTALSAGDFLYAQEYDENGVVYEDSNEENDEELLNEADKFAQNYFGYDSIEDVRSYLYDNYGEFLTEEEDPLHEKVESILAFYGFPDLLSALGYEDPYKGEWIDSLVAHLSYLNAYYEENGLS